VTPLPIRLFAVCYFGQALMGTVHNALTSDRMQAQIEQNLQLPYGRGEPWVVTILAVRVAVAAILVWMVCARANNVAKWIVVVLSLGRVWQAIGGWAEIVTGLTHGNSNSIAWTIESAIYFGAGVCLFLPQSRYWFVTKGRSMKAEASAFE
jgi:hypothetical protein